MLVRDPLNIRCPKCGHEAHWRCTTAAGKPTVIHLDRWKAVGAVCGEGRPTTAQLHEAGSAAHLRFHRALLIEQQRMDAGILPAQELLRQAAE